MWIFSIFLLPISFLIQNSIKRSSAVNVDKSSSFVFILGLVFGAFYSTAAMLLFSTNPYVQFNLPLVFFQKLIFLTIPPFAVLYLLLFIFSKNPLSDKTLLFTDLLYGFYSIYLPFTILSYNKVYSFYPLFIEPLVFLLMLTAVKISTGLLVKGIIKKIHPVFYAVFSLFLMLSLCFPPLMQTLFVLGYPWFSLFLLFCGFTMMTFAAHLLVRRLIH